MRRRETPARPAAQHPRRYRVDVVVMVHLRRALAPLVIAVLATLALVAPGAVGAKGTPPIVIPGASGPTGATGPTVVQPLLTASVTACHADALAANRYATFASQLTAVPNTRTMTVEFQLQERATKDGPFTTVSNAPGFGVWVASQPGVGIYTYSHEVTSLPAPAAFRVLVHARWLDRRHRVIHREELLSPVCMQPVETPNLAIGTLRHAPGAAARTVVYSVQVINGGPVAAGTFQVSLTVNGVALTNASLPGLAADTAQVVQFNGPPCTAGSTLTAVADPTGAVVEPANPARTKSFPCVR